MITPLNTSDLCGYSVLINTPQWLTEQVESMQYEFATKSEKREKQQLTSQIPLVNLLSAQSDVSDENIVKSVERIASVIHCFRVAYTGFSFFDTGSAFRINIKDQDQLISLRDLLQEELQSFQLLSHAPKPTFNTTFSMKPGGAYHEFTNWSSTNDFRVSSLSILKKVAGSNTWEFLKEVPFGRA